MILQSETLTNASKTYLVTLETFDSISTCWRNEKNSLKWNCLFVLPAWLRAWWSIFGNELKHKPYLCTVRLGEDPIGFAPLLLGGERATLMGDPDVCDYMDCTVVPGMELPFFGALIQHLRQGGVTRLDLGPLRGDSVVFTSMNKYAEGLGCEVSIDEEDITVELDLPKTWSGFLRLLTGKERHEIRRKLRRLREAGEIRQRVATEASKVKEGMDTFLDLFRMNREDKAAFMTARRASFFRVLADALAELGILRLSLLELDGSPAAAVMCFDYNGTIYLYNNSYNSIYRSLSVGLMSKVLSIRESIEMGRQKYDFLKGVEAYKERLGGKPIPLYRCHVTL